MQLPETPPPPLAPLWERVLRARALPPDLDVELLYVAIRDRLTHPEWEVRLHALRVLADLLPLAGNALAFPFDQVVDNLGHGSPNVRKAALDALKVFCTHCEDAECAARAILDKCYYHNIRPHPAGIDAKMNVITGLILSIPSVMGILKRRHQTLDMFPVFQILGEKLFDPVHRDVAHRAMMKLRKACSPKEYAKSLSRLDLKIQDKYRFLCDNYDEDSLDVYYAPRKTLYQENNNQHLVKVNGLYSNSTNGPIRGSMDSSSEESYGPYPFYNNNFAKVIIETEIKFDSDTAITMTVLEETETESERQTGSEDGYDSSDQNMLKYSDGDGDGDSEDIDVVVKKVRFGGESVKIRTPDSENFLSSEDDVNKNKLIQTDNIEVVARPVTSAIVDKMNEIKREAIDRESNKLHNKKSGIPLPVIINKPSKPEHLVKYNRVKLKSKSLSELYDYFRSKNGEPHGKLKEFSGFALTISEVRSPQKVPSPVEPHREVQVLHNLQRSPVVSPRRQMTKVQLNEDEFVMNVLASSPPPREDLRSPRAPTPLRAHYDWEELDILPRHFIDQLHNTENWIAVVKAADHLHSALLDSETVRKVEPAALSLVKHMWALSDEVSAAKAPAEGAVCALVRSVSSDCARQLLPSLVSRMAKEPLPAALPHALLQRLALHHLVDLIFDPTMIGDSDAEHIQSAQLRATLCLARAAGPASVLSAVRRRLAGTARADVFCNKLRERLNRPLENIKPSFMARSSQLPVPVRRRARSTPPPVMPAPPRRLRPLPDSAPLPSTSQLGREYLMQPLTPIPMSGREIMSRLKPHRAASISRDREVAAAKRGRAAWGVTRQSRRRRGGTRPPTGMLRLCCCPRHAAVTPSVSSVGTAAPVPRLPDLKLDLVADLPPLTWDSSGPATYDEKDSEQSARSLKSNGSIGVNGDDVIDNATGSAGSVPAAELTPSPPSSPPPPPSPPLPSSPRRSPSIRVEDLFEKNPSLGEGDDVSRRSPSKSESPGTEDGTSQKSENENSVRRSASPDITSAVSAPDDAVAVQTARGSRDVRAALIECTLPARHEDWEAIVAGLAETARLAADPTARAPAASWRGAARSCAAHVRSLRSRVARAACLSVGVLWEHRGRALDPEMEEAAAALLDRCADANRFLRADAATALGKIACGGAAARAVTALCRRGATHRAPPVRAAAAAALARLVLNAGAARALSLPPDARTLLLRAAGDLLGDACADARTHARRLCLALADDARFQPLLKEATPPTRYRSVEKLVEKLR